MTVKVPPRSSSGVSLPRLRRFGEALDLGVELVERARVAVAHDRHDEPLLGLHRDADVVAVEQHEVVAVDARVQLRELLQRGGDGLQHARQQLLQVDVAEVGLLDPRDRGDLVRAREVLEHLAADAADRLAPLRRRGRCGSAAAADVGLGDSPLRPGAGDRREIDAELLREPPDERRRAHLLAL